MQLALSLAKKSLGLTGQNPSVGSVLQNNKTGEVISTGVTSASGRPHGEVNCLDGIDLSQQKLEDLTLFVTLEPCSHHGKTPPCAEFIIKKGIKNVVIGCSDPDARVSGKGVRILQNAGVNVYYNNLDGKITHFYKSYIYARKNKVPYLTAKLAITLDGKVCLANDESKWITSQEQRRYSNFMRYKYDAIAVSGKTFRNDNPSLNIRYRGLEQYNPRRLIISKRLTNVSNSGFEIFSGDGYLGDIYHAGVNWLLLEGSRAIFTDLYKKNLINEIVIYQSSKIFGDDAQGFIDNLNLTEIKESNYKLIESKIIGEDSFLRLINKSLETLI